MGQAVQSHALAHSSVEKQMAKEVYPGVTVDPDVVHGRPVVAGTRVPVEVVTGELAGGSTYPDVMENYHLTEEQIRAALGYVTQLLSSTMIYAAS